MYSGSGFSDWEIGDITVIIHEGEYHLFHLIIPNHDYIAHAVSDDGISWRRVNNALFVGHPGEWDDDMLWTMDVIKNGHLFKMYYTGLQRKDRGVISRLGLAESANLIDWEKRPGGMFPIEPKGVYYETYQSNPRTWLSFRDPFYFEHNGEEYLIFCSRTIHGPVSRRGCVGIVKITGGKAQLMPPLLYPMVYDDIECPCIFNLNGYYYILGSIREDIKVRYWFSPEFMGEYHSFHADLLLPQGNYAARVVRDGEHLLIYNFFSAYGRIDAHRVLPPPKQLDTDAKGRLLLKSYYRWDQMVKRTVVQNDFGPIRHSLDNPTASSDITGDKWTCRSESGYEFFYFKKHSDSYIWEGLLAVEGLGKLGLVCDLDEESNGYFISLDVVNGLVQIRAWGFNPQNAKQNFVFNNIQSGTFKTNGETSFAFRLIRFGNYIELSLDGVVQLTLMDYTYSGSGLGLYSSSSVISLQKSVFKVLPDPREEYVNADEIPKLN